ncbi:endoplasmic reticulum lectin 1 [Teleopsis dalmanni]|uniref:endoplasmic reticulum lectin 1 n=1 Tax=Teleopsis dalmanni TaxID=139649 RepID=UPI0018CF629D|nr:endoplasmic reticulum lectin 1 [Teleopsis dalmanni]
MDSFCAISRRNVYIITLVSLWVTGYMQVTFVQAHDIKDFDDAILYKIDFEMPDFEKNPDLKNHLKTFHTHEKEKYDCVIPTVEDTKVEKKTNEPELSLRALLEPIFSSTTCNYRIEAYWSYELCHGSHMRQYHEEREGKTTKFQEYYLGKWSEEKTEKLVKQWDENQKAGIKFKTTKIDNTRYPYLELEMNDGTLCDIINAPRTTVIRYVCYLHGKNEIYSFKETSSCNYEVIILTSVLCMMPVFHPEETKEVSIMCFNSPTEPHKPLSMLRQELNDLQTQHTIDDDIPVTKEATTIALTRTTAAGDRYLYLNRIGGDVDKLALDIMMGAGIDIDGSRQSASTGLSDITPIKAFISGKNCLTGGSGWWKYEFCYGRHVRQFHNDKKVETEVFLGYFNERDHRLWMFAHPDKVPTKNAQSIWHHYEKGTLCDRTGLPREVDVKLTCTPVTQSSSSVAMYLLEPKTCQYILVVESPIVCDLITVTDEFGLVNDEKLQKLQKMSNTDIENVNLLNKYLEKLSQTEDLEPVEVPTQMEQVIPENVLA